MLCGGNHKMKIAVIDIAAEKSGALSVLQDFYNYVSTSPECEQHEWYFFLCKKFFEEKQNIKIITLEKIKQSRIKRVFWDNFSFKKIDKKEKFDVTLSLQSASVKTYQSKLIVYFHNALLLKPKKTFSLFKKEQRMYAIYTHFIGPYTIKSLKVADSIIVQTETIKNKLDLRLKNRKKIYVLPPNLSKISVNHNWSGTLKGFIYPATPIVFKRIDLIVEFAKELQKKHPELKIILTLNGKENKLAEKIKKEADSIGNIELIGFVERNQILNLYSSYALIWASEIESFPIPFIEASMIGTPILVSDEDYALEILKEYPKAFFYQKGNIESMIQNTEKLLNCKDNSIVQQRLYNSWQQLVEIITTLQ